MSNHDGGPAFPLLEDEKHYRADGMSLLDYFAGQALAGILADHEFNSEPDIAAKVAYNYARAMIKEREQ